MKRAKATFVYLMKIMIAGIVAVGILSLFVLLYQNTGIHIDNTTGATDYKWEPNQYKSTMVEGFAWFYMDQDGFNNAYASKKDIPDILLMGSSHMEAVQIKSTQNVAYLLNELLPELYTYNIGMSGHTIYRCVANMKDAVQIYQPQQYLIIETDELVLSETELQAVVDGNYEKLPSYDSGLIYQLQKIPALKWLYKSLGEWMSADLSSVALAADDPMADYKEVLNDFLKKAQTVAKEASIQLVIFYHPAERLTSSGEISYDTEPLYLDTFKKLCEENDIIFVDMTESLALLYEQQYKLGHGFDNTEVGTGHLNQYGHRIIAEKLCEIIREQEGK